jgi:hypothetical protein
MEINTRINNMKKLVIFMLSALTVISCSKNSTEIGYKEFVIGMPKEKALSIIKDKYENKYKIDKNNEDIKGKITYTYSLYRITDIKDKSINEIQLRFDHKSKLIQIAIGITYLNYDQFNAIQRSMQQKYKKHKVEESKSGSSIDYYWYIDNKSKTIQLYTDYKSGKKKSDVGIAIIYTNKKGFDKYYEFLYNKNNKY